MTLLADPTTESSVATAASVIVVSGVFFVPGVESDDLVEEPMDYTPIAAGDLMAPDVPEEEWPEGSGPNGY